MREATSNAASGPQSCRLSVVVTSRNDDHGGQMLKRMTLFIEGLLQLANKYGLAGELLIVEWNPPPGPRLHDIIQVRTRSEHFTLRFIEVPPGCHASLRNANAMPLFQMIAKNVGIRRARGEFVLATNPDLLFSEELIRFLASGDLRTDVMYRIDRHDVEADVPEDVPVAQQLYWCAAHVLRVHRRLRSVVRKTSRRRFRLSARGLLARCLEAGRSIRSACRRLSSKPFSRAGFRRLRAIPAKAIHRMRGGLYHLSYGFTRLLDPLAGIHTNGCGDFTLFARQGWLQLRGYPELPLWSMHIDSLLCYMAVASGLRQEIMKPPAMIFHLEHDHSWVVIRPEDRLRRFVDRPWLDGWTLREIAWRMLSSSVPIEYNAADWGLGNLPLREVRICSGVRHLVEVPAPVQPVVEANSPGPPSVHR